MLWGARDFRSVVLLSFVFSCDVGGSWHALCEALLRIIVNYDVHDDCKAK